MSYSDEVMMSHDHISFGVLQICYLENDRAAVL